MLRDLSHGEKALVRLIVFQQRSALRYRRDPFRATRELHNPSCASCEINNLAESDQAHDQYVEHQSHLVEGEQL